MRWSPERKAGFATGEPWLPIGPEVERLNVATQRADLHFLLALYRALLWLRREEPALNASTYEPLRGAPDVLMVRRLAARREPALLVVLNIASGPQDVILDRESELLLSTHSGRAGKHAAGRLRLRPDEGIVLRMGKLSR